MKFDESKIIDTLHPEKAVVGKEYYYADGAHKLKELVESGNAPVGKYAGLANVGESFSVGGKPYYLLYPAPVIPFDEARVINTLHPEKAVFGKRYYFADDIAQLKEIVECKSLTVSDYTGFDDGRFRMAGCGHKYLLLYPVE